MLTGDKGETAKQIGISCGLLTANPDLFGVRLVEIDDKP